MDRKVEKWAKDNQLTQEETELVSDIVCDIPGEYDEFYLKLEGIGNKHYIPEEKKMSLIQWIRLTTELFRP